jgi:hypothetical protein
MENVICCMTHGRPCALATMSMYGKVRRTEQREKVSINELAHNTRLSRNTITN